MSVFVYTPVSNKVASVMHDMMHDPSFIDHKLKHHVCYK